ncbi:MAG TPA: glycogen/starch/alpha-glucan phosphorylase, partial [Phycisphaerae bacterium]
LISRHIGDSWINFTEHDLRNIEPQADQAEFRAQWRAVKLANKKRLSALIWEGCKTEVDPNSLFDVQVKRIHEYKRQHLNLLGVIAAYNRIRKNPAAPVAPRTVIFGGKAAPGYYLAKLIIKLANSVAQVIDRDPLAAGKLKVIFVPDFSVKTGQIIYPAADLSEQISTAGKEASGTGNMKFALNGALTIGTLDGANVEIRDEVGHENFFLFGMNTQQVQERRRSGYNPWHEVESNAELREVIDQLASGYFSNGDRGLFRPLLDSLLGRDEYMVLADFAAYVECQKQVDLAWHDPDRWARMSILNVARSGKFSSDRSIREYCREIWNVEPMPVDDDASTD